MDDYKFFHSSNAIWEEFATERVIQCNNSTVDRSKLEFSDLRMDIETSFFYYLSIFLINN